ncbi:MAG: Kae1-associated serine/threonine protein kinase [Candidatus Micrarchaeales archaeon]|nr:Kae1-associated serine/threonine protein kinase [Candidatus Micrarchaeales archaeon]
MEKLSEGAESILYAAEIAGIPAVVKDRVVKSYRARALDDEIRSRRTKSEARILARASAAGVKVPKVLMLGEHQIFIERLDGGTLNAIVQEGKAKKEQLEWIFLESGRRLAELHALDIAHGDYTPANIMVSSSGVFVIDFGLAEVTKSSEEKALDLLLMKRSVSRKLYRIFLSSYSATFSDAEAITERLEEIEKRGRYQTRTLVTG